MADWFKVDEARSMPGLRLVLTEGVPNPWAEGAKALFEVKRIPYARVAQHVLGRNRSLQEWTGQTSAPVAVWNDERPRTTWSEIVFLAERLQPEPALIPAAAEERQAMFGFLHELCGEMGLGWCRRLHFARAALDDPASPLHPVGEYIAGRYGGAWAEGAALAGRIRDLLALFAAQLHRQRSEGRGFFVGERLSALDLYWATFTALIQPLPPDQCAMHDLSRQLYTLTDAALLSRVDPILLEHRDRIYRDHLTLPVVLR